MKSQLSLLTTRKYWVSLLALIFGFCCFLIFDAQAALAHTPHDDIEVLEVSPAYEQDQTLFVIVRQNLLKSSDSGKSWQRLTKGIDNRYVLKSLSISPQNSHEMYLSSLGDGIFYSHNQGKSWQRVNDNLDDLEIDLVSVVTDDLVFATGYKQGLYRTIDRGNKWTKVFNKPSKITAIASRIIEDKNLIIFSDKDGKLYLSEDEGNSWVETQNFLDKNEIQTIAISPNFFTDKTFLVGTKGGGIFKTVDGGNSFQPVTQGLTDDNIISVQFFPNYQADSKVFASSWDKGLFVSVDKGNTWTLFSQGLTTDGQANRKECPKPLTCPRPHFSDLKLANSNAEKPTLFLAGFDGLFTSINGGETWNQIETLLPRLIVALDVSPNHVKDSNLAFTTYIGGTSLSKSKGEEWNDINSGLENVGRYLKYEAQINRLFKIIFSPNYIVDKTLFASGWNSLYTSENGGRKWHEQKPLPFKNASAFKGLFIIAVSPDFASDKTVYIGNRLGNIFKSTDGGIKFKHFSQIGEWLYSLVISPNYNIDNTLYASSANGIYKTIDGGRTWDFVSQTISFPEPTDFSLPNEIKLAISPNYSIDKTVFAGTYYGLFVTHNGGKNWKKLSGGETYDENGKIAAIAISPDYQNDQTLFISVKGEGLFKTTDGGKSFTQIQDELINDNNLLLNAEGLLSTASPIKFSPTYGQDQTIYGYSWKNLFRSTDGGLTWQKLSLPDSAYKSPFSYWYFPNNIPYLLNFSSPKRKLGVFFVASFLGYLLFRHMKRKKLLS
jgi:photosystem II stability/assembly factor-like uncharacterized protein